MASLEFRCGNCGKMLSVGDNVTGSITCPHCQAATAVPAALRPRPMPVPQVEPRPMRPGEAGKAQPAAAAAQPQPAPQGAGEQEELEEEESPAWAVLAMLLPWAVSLCFHVGVFLLLMFFTFIIVSPGEGGEDDGLVLGDDQLAIPTDKWGDSDTPGSRVLTDFAGIEPYGAGKDKTDFSKPAADLADQGGTAGGGKEDQYAAIGILVPGATGTAGGRGDGTGVGTAGLGNMFGAGGDGGGRGSRFFGSGLPKPSLVKVIYVVDSSGSMFETFAYVKAELTRSVNDLHQRMQFQVIFFSDGTPSELSIDGQTRLQQATPGAKRAMKQWVDERIAQSKTGRTDPRPALEKAFKTAGGPPHLIYFLTDGLFPRETLETLKRLNPNKKVHINTIAFMDRVGEELMQKIAQENGGTYKFISQDQLGQEY